MERITQKMLERQVDRLNKLTGNSLKPWTRNESGKYCAQIGNFHIEGAYGGVSLFQMEKEPGGVHDIFRTGHIPKRELYGLINAYMEGIDYAMARQKTRS